MAHKGKVYERYFRRDLSYRHTDGTYRYLPKYYKWDLGPATIFPGYPFPRMQPVSLAGEQLDERTVRWLFLFPTVGPGDAFATFDYHLRLDSSWSDTIAMMGTGGTPRIISTSFGNAQLQPTFKVSGPFTLIAPPHTPNNFQFGNGAPARWSEV